MFHSNYAFQSGTSGFMSRHFELLASQLADSVLAGQARPFVVEIGSNDGVFLKHMAARGVAHLGIEPSSNVADLSAQDGVSVHQAFFGSDTAQYVLDRHGPASLIFAANAMCHIPDIADVADACGQLLSDDGVLIFEDPYLGDVLRLGSYDQIYDEHVFLFSATSVKRVFRSVGLELVDLESLSTHGGSMRYTLARQGALTANPSVAQILDAEDRMGMSRVETYHEFAQRVAKSAQDLRSLIEAKVEAGNEVVAYGATSKSTTVYNYAGIGPDLISALYDSTPTKQGTLSPGVHIPVVPESDFERSRADMTFLGAWNHEAEIRSKNSAYEARGGKWITHVPEVRILA